MTQQIEAAGRRRRASSPSAVSPRQRGGGGRSHARAVRRVGCAGRGTRLLASVFAVVLLCYFYLVYGDALLAKVVALSPSLEHERSAIDILRTMQRRDVPYLFTTTLINAAVGLGAGLIAWSLRLEDALFRACSRPSSTSCPMWGRCACCWSSSFWACCGQQRRHGAAAASLFGALIVLEGQFVTPWILGRRLKAQPVAILLWLMLLGWLWGPVGWCWRCPALVVVKIVCERVEGWDWLARAVE